MVPQALQRGSPGEPQGASSDDAVTQHRLGRQHSAQGNYRASVECYFAGLAVDAAYPEAWLHLGDALRQLGEADAACEAYRNALLRRTPFPEAWFALATQLTVMRRIDDAAAAFHMALLQQPDCHEARTNLAIFHYVAGNDSEALAELGKALDFAPADARALLLTARVQLRLGSFAPAENACRAVLSLEPDHSEALVLLGRVLYEADRVSEAASVLEQAVAIAPTHAEARNEFGVTLKALGRLDEARAQFREGLRLDPAMHGAYDNIADLADFAKDPELARQITHVTAALVADEARPTGSSDPLIPMHFASGKMLDRLGEPALALEHFVAGGRLLRASLDYDEAEYVRFCAGIKAAFSQEFFAHRQASGDPSHAPIFIVGMPRSGSTLVEQILGAHPAIHAGGEVKLLTDAVNLCRQHNPTLPPYPALASILTQEHLTEIAATYLDKTLAPAGGALRVTDKLLSNYFFAGLIHVLFPNAKIINTLRDPIDTCLSSFTTRFGEDLPYTYDFAELGRHYCRYVDLMAHWRDVLPEGVMTSVIYEDVVTDTEVQARRLLSFLDLPWHDACLEFYKAPGSVKTASAVQVRKPVYTSAVARWRRYGPGLEPLIAALQPTIGQSGGLRI